MSKHRSRRQRGPTRRDEARAQNRQMLRQLCARVAEFEEPLDVEQTASMLLGQLWLARGTLPPDALAEHAVALGMPIIQDVARIGGRGARILLKAISRIEQGGLGVEASQLAAGIHVGPDPAWLTSLGCAEVVSARSKLSVGEGEAIVLEARGADMRPHAAAAFIDHRLGGIAKIATLIQADAGSIAGCQVGFDLRPTDHLAACERVRAAIARTDADPRAPVHPDFASRRAVVVARAHLPAGVDFGPAEVAA